MAQLQSFEGSSDAPLRDMTLDACLGNLATHLQIAGQAWVEGNIYERTHTRNRKHYGELFLRIFPEELPDGGTGHRVIVDSDEQPRDGSISAEHVFDDEWQPVDEGAVHVVEGRIHSYWLRLDNGQYIVNDGVSSLPEADMGRLRHVTSLVAAHALVVVETMNDQYWCG